MIYLDNSSTAQPSEQAICKMLPFLTEMWGSSTSPHDKGQELIPHIKDSLAEIYSLLGADPSDRFVFTSSGAEAINHAFLTTFLDLTRQTGQNQFITVQTEEAPILMSISRLEQLGCVGKMISATPQGTINLDELAESINPRTAMISISAANSLTGVVQPYNEIAVLCKQKNIRFHLDVTHILGKLFFNAKEINADFITFNGEQIHAPKGTGGFLAKHSIHISPFIVGGLEQAGLRAGNINVPALVALGAAAKEAIDSRDYLCTEINRLRNKLEQSLTSTIPNTSVLFQESLRLPNISCIAFHNILNENLLFHLNRKNICASIGGGSTQQISLILSASSIPTTLAHSAINFSLSRYNTEPEIDSTSLIITQTHKHLCKLLSSHILH